MSNDRFYRYNGPPEPAKPLSFRDLVPDDCWSRCSLGLKILCDPFPFASLACGRYRLGEPVRVTQFRATAGGFISATHRMPKSWGSSQIPRLH